MIAPDRIAFTIFGIDVMWYGVLIGAGFIIAAAICYYRAPKHDFDSDFIVDLVIWMIPCAIVGARGYYILFTFENYRGRWKDIFMVRDGGLAIHGALILCFIVAFFLCKRRKQSFIKGADLVAVTIPLAQSIGRWGNFFNQEAHGGPTDLPWAQVINGVGYHPTFLYESIWCFLLFWFLLWFDNKKRTYDGQVLCLYLILYSLERFFVEGLRTDSLMIGNFRQAQIFSVFLILFGIVMMFMLKKGGPITVFLNTGFASGSGKSAEPNRDSNEASQCDGCDIDDEPGEYDDPCFDDSEDDVADVANAADLYGGIVEADDNEASKCCDKDER